MRIKYSPDSDIIIFELKKDIPDDSIDLGEGIIVHYNKNKQPIEIEILDASTMTNIEEINVALPLSKAETVV